MANTMLEEAEKALGAQVQTTGPTLRWGRVMAATSACLGVTLLAAVPGWMYLSGSITVYLAALVGLLVLGVVVARRSPVKPVLALGYSAVLGLVMGGFTASAVAAGGNYALIGQAVLGTFIGTISVVLFSTTNLGSRLGRGGKFFVAALLGYALLGMFNIVLALMGVGDGWGIYGVGPLGVALCLLGVAFASWSLLVDITSANKMVDSGAPDTWAWSLGLGIASSVVWMYLELLRLLSILNR